MTTLPQAPTSGVEPVPVVEERRGITYKRAGIELHKGVSRLTLEGPPLDEAELALVEDVTTEVRFYYEDDLNASAVRALSDHVEELTEQSSGREAELAARIAALEAANSHLLAAKTSLEQQLGEATSCARSWCAHAQKLQNDCMEYQRVLGGPPSAFCSIGARCTMRQ